MLFKSIINEKIFVRDENLRRDILSKYTRIFLHIQYMIWCFFIFFGIKYAIQIYNVFVFRKKNNDIKISIFLWKNKIAEIWIIFR